MKRAITLIIALAFIISSCRPKAELYLEMGDSEARSEGQTFLFHVISTYPWSAEPCDSIEISPLSASGDSPVSITVFENPRTVKRNFTVTFSSSDEKSTVSKSINITQLSSAPFLSAGYAEEPSPDKNGFTATLRINANTSWSVISDISTDIIEPSTGTFGTSDITVTIGKNSSIDPLEHNYTFTAEDSTTIFSITQPGADPEIHTEFIEEPVLSGYGFEAKVKVVSNVPWSVTSDNEHDIITPSSGEKGTSEIVLFVSKNTTNENSRHSFSFVAETANDTIAFDQPPITILSYGGVDYKVHWLLDGNLWMCENLRYVPEGKTISTDPADNNGIWYSSTAVEPKEAQTDPDSVAVKGLLYNTETAFGDVVITKDNFNSFAGVQGICPDGWHIPTGAELLGLVGKGVGFTTNPDAPYYVLKTDNSSVALANADGFNIASYGYRYQGSNIVTGKYVGTCLNGRITMDYIMGSSPKQKNGEPTYTPVSNDDPTLKNVMFPSIMLFMDNSHESMNLADNAYKSGTHVRCVMD